MDTVRGRRRPEHGPDDNVAAADPAASGLAMRERDRTGAGTVGRARMGVVGTEPEVAAAAMGDWGRAASKSKREAGINDSKAF